MHHPSTGALGLTADAAVARLRAMTSLVGPGDDLSLDGGLEVLTRSFAEQVAAQTALLVACNPDDPLAPVRASWGLRTDTHGTAVRRGEGTAGRLLDGGSGGRPCPGLPGGGPHRGRQRRSSHHRFGRRADPVALRGGGRAVRGLLAPAARRTRTAGLGRGGIRGRGGSLPRRLGAAAGV